MWTNNYEIFGKYVKCQNIRVVRAILIFILKLRRCALEAFIIFVRRFLVATSASPRQSFKASQTLEQNSCGLQAEWSPLDICRKSYGVQKNNPSDLPFFSQHQSWYTTATCKRGAQRRNWVNAPTQLRQGVWGTTNSTFQGAEQE